MIKTIAKNLSRAITGALSATMTTRKCPTCGRRAVMRVAFGAKVLGHSCRRCKWEKPG